jgi:hypothetical protein
MMDFGSLLPGNQTMSDSKSHIKMPENQDERNHNCWKPSAKILEIGL